MVEFLKLTVINDNVPGKGLINEWGWSILAESEKWIFLFDADTDPQVIEHNSKALGIDLKKLNFAVLSHWHGDHYGGFEYLGRVSRGLKVYVPPGETGLLEGWGLKEEVVRQPMKLAEDLWSTGPLGFFIKEQAVGVFVNGLGYVVIVGCSHPGADRLASKIAEITKGNIYMVVGGYHEPPLSVLDNLAKISKLICPAHCSGERAKEYVRRKHPEKYCEVRTGSIIKLP